MTAIDEIVNAQGLPAQRASYAPRARAVLDGAQAAPLGPGLSERVKLGSLQGGHAIASIRGISPITPFGVSGVDVRLLDIAGNPLPGRRVVFLRLSDVQYDPNAPQPGVPVSAILVSNPGADFIAGGIGWGLLRTDATGHVRVLISRAANPGARTVYASLQTPPAGTTEGPPLQIVASPSVPAVITA
tara:strand:- start:5858 stop:6418 length:561 start_codon:yes stop_codon:yes gene_type:complete